jgi:hypothetical protein
MNCQCCGGTAKLVQVTAKCSDMYSQVSLKSGKHYHGYVPEWIGPNGYGDYIEMTICRHCGHIQGDWPHYRTEDKFKHGKAI